MQVAEQRDLKKKVLSAFLAICLSVIANRVDRILPGFEVSPKQQGRQPDTPPNTPDPKVPKRQKKPRGLTSHKVAPRKNCCKTGVRGVNAFGQGSATSQNSQQQQVTRIVSPDQDTKGATPVIDLPNISDGTRIASHPPALIAISTPKPRYPRLALDTRIEGKVTLFVGVSPDGIVYQVKGKGNPILLKAAEDAVIEWRYKPYTPTEKDQLVWKQAIVNFKR